MSSSPSWPPPPRPTSGPPVSGPSFEQPAAYGHPASSAQPAGYGQPAAYGQLAAYGPAGQPSPYGASVPAPPPRPEKRLMPGVWWSLVINLVATVLIGLAVLLVGWAIVEMVTTTTGEDVGWRDALGNDDVAAVVGVVALAMVTTLLVSWLLTVGALVLWRLIRGFRTIPVFVQALVAWFTMWVVTSVLSFLAQIVFGFLGVVGGGSTY